jgi:hypothetical protein
VVRHLRNVDRLFRFLRYGKFFPGQGRRIRDRNFLALGESKMLLLDTVVSDRPVDGCGNEWSLESEKVCSHASCCQDYSR